MGKAEDILTQSGCVASRRTFMGGVVGSAVASWSGLALGQPGPVTFGLTPVFLDSDIRLLAALKGYLEKRLSRRVTLVKKRTYQEITLMLLSGQLDAAWICGFPFIRYRDQLSLMAVPVYNGKPLYQSYVIVNETEPAAKFSDLRGRTHAFSDPDSNSGFLVTRSLLAELGERPETYFSKSFFTYGHRNVIRAVASGLAQSGSVDGYVWDVMNSTKPDMTARTRVIRKSEMLGFPPVACNKSARNSKTTRLITEALISMPEDNLGREVLATLHLDGFQPGSDSLFKGIASLYEIVKRQT